MRKLIITSIITVLLTSAPIPAVSQVACFQPTNAGYTASGGPVTDGGTIRLRATQLTGFAPVLEGAHYVLSGYRYNRTPPTAGLPKGEGKERIHRSCHRIGPPVAGSTVDYELTLGRDLPSGDYFLGVVRDCPADLEQEICEDTHNFLVAPSYMTTTLDTLNVHSNSEERDDHPSEMKFQFASYSGKPFISGQASTSKITLSGSYPDGPRRSGHLTQGDETVIRPNLPVFVGRQSQMFSEECLEEARAFPATVAEQSAARCTSDEAQGRFSDHFEFAVTGVEFDSSNADTWAKVAGAAAVGLSCLLKVKAAIDSGGATSPALGDCVAGATTLGTSVGAFVEKALSEDDDNLGNVGLDFQLQPNLTWPPSGTQGFGPHDFVAGGGGRLSAVFRNRVSGGLRLLNYKIELEEIEILEGYEIFSGCKEPQEVYAIARAYAFEGTDYPASKKLPINTDFFSIPITFAIPPTIAANSFTIADAPESPALYVEIGVWESDGDDRDGDLMGLISATHHWQDLFALSHPSHEEFEEILHIDGRTPEGLPTRELRASFSLEGKGFVGSDKHCADLLNNQADAQLFVQQDRNGNQGHVRVTYRITATWLRNVLR